MTKINGTIVLLIILGAFLCLYCTAGKSLMTGEYDARLVGAVKSLTKTDIGQKLAKHYLRQINLLAHHGIIRYPDISNPTEEERVYLMSMLGRVIFGGLATLLVSLISLAVIFINGTKPTESPHSRWQTVLILILIVVNGSLIRLIMAATFYGNCDMKWFTVTADTVLAGDNIYATMRTYNYSPLWALVLAGLKKIQLQIPIFSFSFVLKSFLCLVDLGTLTFLILIARGEKRAFLNTAIFFYLNPVSFLLTGYHGQFENVAIFMLLGGLFAYLNLRYRHSLGVAILWFMATAAMIIKHNIFFELIICLNTALKRYRIKLVLFALSVCAFLATFAPYWAAGSKEIISNVFMYSSEGYASEYGIRSLFNFPAIKYVFITGLLVFGLFLKNQDIIRNCLMGMLFFLTFTTGIAIQYFVLPIALGALRLSREFLLYSFATTLFLLGNRDNVFVPGFHMLGGNIVWLSAIYWFALEMKRSNETQLKSLQEVQIND
jgi:hypothetical protein